MSEHWQTAQQQKAVDLAAEGLRTVILINGAGATGILVLLGQTLSLFPDHPHLGSRLVCALAGFVIGALLGGFATVAAYITQYAIGVKFGGVAKPAHIAAMVLVVLSYLAFIVAAITGLIALYAAFG